MSTILGTPLIIVVVVSFCTLPPRSTAEFEQLPWTAFKEVNDTRTATMKKNTESLSLAIGQIAYVYEGETFGRISSLTLDPQTKLTKLEITIADKTTLRLEFATDATESQLTNKPTLGLLNFLSAAPDEFAAKAYAYTVIPFARHCRGNTEDEMEALRQLCIICNRPDAWQAAQRVWVPVIVPSMSETTLSERYLQAHPDMLTSGANIVRYNATTGVYDVVDVNAEISQAVARAWVCVRGGKVYAAPLSIGVDAVSRIIKQVHKRLPRAIPDAGLCLNNGFLSISAEGVKLEPFSPVFHALHKIPVDYDPTATCPKFFESMYLVCSGNQAIFDCLGEFFGTALFGKITEYQKALILLGEGSNGKSTLIDAIKTFLPESAISTIGLQQLQDRESRSKLAGVKINVAQELPKTGIRDTSAIKSVISGEEVDARIMYVGTVSIKPQAAHVFSCNELPTSVDQTKGFWRRFIVIPFDAKLPTADEEGFKSVADMLDIYKTETQGILRWLVSGAVRVTQTRKITEPAVAKAAKAEWQSESENVARFIADCCEIVPLGSTGNEMKHLHYVFQRYLDAQGALKFSINKVAFQNQVKRILSLPDAIPQTKDRDKKRLYPLLVRGLDDWDIVIPQKIRDDIHASGVRLTSHMPAPATTIDLSKAVN